MFRSLFVACAIFPLLLLAACENAVLVERPPVYQEGEVAKGVLIDQTTDEHLTLDQQAAYGPDRQMYVLISATDKDDKTRTLLFNPQVWQFQAYVNEATQEVMRTLETTCSARSLYPIWLGKKYECSSLVEVNGQRVSFHSRMHFDSVEHDATGGITGFCAMVEEKDGEQEAVLRICASPGGRWLRALHILKSTQHEKI